MIEMQRLNAPFPIFRGRALPLLPDSWEADVIRTAGTHGHGSTLDGVSFTSRELDFGEPRAAELEVVDGSGVAAELPWLFALYTGAFLDTANELGLGAFRVAEDQQSAINLNVQRNGQRYEWHVDSNPLTGLLFASSLATEEGGTLIFRRDPRWADYPDFELQIQPEMGTLYLYDARHAVHAVTPVTAERTRISIPMNYYFAGQAIERPADLDSYLYGST